jgi:hypothetical protein
METKRDFRKQWAGGRKQEAVGRRQEAGGLVLNSNGISFKQLCKFMVNTYQINIIPEAGRIFVKMLNYCVI